MKQLEAVTAQPPMSAGGTLQNVELRHLRYFVAIAEAGSFTDAAERMFIAQPTLSQQLRRLEDIIGTQLLHRRREGVRLTTAGAVLLETSRTILSLVDHGVNHTRHAAGLGRQRLQVIMPPHLPDALAAETASRLMSAAVAADVDVTWLEAPLDGEFSPIRQRKADAGLGWLTGAAEELPAPLDVMSLGEFEPRLWIPSRHPAAGRGTITLDELTLLPVVHGPRRGGAGTYDAWLEVLRSAGPHFAFTDPPFSHSLPMALAFAATESRPTAVLTGPCVAVPGAGPPARPPQLADEPLAIEQARAGQLGYGPALPQVLDGLLVLGLGLVVVGEQRPAASQQPEGQGRAAGQGQGRKGLQRPDGGRPVAASDAGLDHRLDRAQFRHRPVREGRADTVQRLLVVAQAQVQPGQRGVRQVGGPPVALLGELAQELVGEGAGVRFLPAPGEAVQLRDREQAKVGPVTGGLGQRASFGHRRLGWTGQLRRQERLQQGVAGQLDVEGLDHLGRVEQDRGRLGQLSRGTHREALQPPGLGSGQRIVQVRRGALQQHPRRRRLAGHQPGFGRLQQSLRPAPAVGRQLGRSFQEHRTAGPAAPAARPVGRALQLGRELLVRARGRRGQVPGPPVWIPVRVAGRGQRLMRPPPRRTRRPVVDR